jgi:SAM-dependent methyltransferase
MTHKQFTSDLTSQFGQIDIYLFDQILRRRIVPPMRIIDAGCGFGRNLVYLLRAGHDVCAVDADGDAVREVRALISSLAPHLPLTNVRQELIEEMTFPDASADVVICSAVLHFARDKVQFDAMLASMWRVLVPGGIFFSRLASSIGMADQVQPLGEGRFRLPDRTERYLVDEAQLVTLTRKLEGALLDPLKTTIVQDQRAMTTWVVRKSD